MGAAQSELSMDEILASIRRIIHEEEETKQPVRPSGENTVVLSEERAAQADASETSAEAEPIEEELADLRNVAASVQAASVTTETAEPVEEPSLETVSLPPLVEEPPSVVTNDAPLHPEQPFEALTAATLNAQSAEPKPSAPVEEAAPTVSSQPEEKLSAMPATKPVEQHAESVETTTKSLVGEEQSQNVAAAFASLKQHVQVTQQSGKTLEDMVAQMIQPMLKAWLNEHLPAIVEQKVEEEVKRLSER